MRESLQESHVCPEDPTVYHDRTRSPWVRFIVLFGVKPTCTKGPTSQSLGRWRNIVKFLKVYGKFLPTAYMTNHDRFIRLKKYIHTRCWHRGQPLNQPEGRLKVILIETILVLPHQLTRDHLPLSPTSYSSPELHKAQHAMETNSSCTVTSLEQTLQKKTASK